MDFAAERTALQETLQPLTNRRLAKTYLDRLQALETEYNATATQKPRKDAIETEIASLHQEAADHVDKSHGHMAPAPPSSTLVMMVGVVVAIVVVCCVALVFWFDINSLGANAKPADRSDALITSTVILVVVGLGASLLIHRLLIRPPGVSAAARMASRAQFVNRPMMMLSGLIAILFFGGIALYLRALDEPISTVRATRPILVFTLIVAMLGFGGLLMVRSLFGIGDDKELNRRFRLAREIFLVYAGIFGTIIGFYFGAADEENIENPPSVTYSASDNALTAQVSGGVPPFIGYLSREDPPLDLLMSGSDRLISLKLGRPAVGESEAVQELIPADSTLDQVKIDRTRPPETVDLLERAQGSCPVGATITVVDGRGRRATADVLPEAVKNWAWPKCGVTGASPTETETETETGKETAPADDATQNAF